VKPSPELLEGLAERFSHAVIAFVDDDGYPVSVATGFQVGAGGTVRLADVGGDEVQPPEGERVNVVFSHIRPQPGIGYDERRYVSLWGPLRRVEGGFELEPEQEQHWDETEMTFFEYSERGVPQARRYMDRLSEESGREVRPRLAFGWLFLRATRLPFLTATFVPVFLGIAVAALRDGFSWWLALLTVVGGAAIHLGLNLANDVFDTRSGADEANVTPTQFSGGSRVILYGLLSMRQAVAWTVALYAVGLGIGVVLAWQSGWGLLWVGVVGALISIFYTAPPLRLVHRGLGEVATAIGFGPVMTLGAYYVQTGEYAWEPFLASLPVAILIALILYVNEIPDRAGDAAAGKRTLPVRWSRETVVNAYVASVAVTFVLIAVFAATGLTARATLIALAAAPLALPVIRGLREHYESPYAFMPSMGKNVQLHLVTGLLLVAGYVIAIVADRTDALTWLA
jgi:1,4-dihydroxy-2-naphthoate octaprenyltransferase